MPKNKPSKGLLKRIRLTKSGRVRTRRAFGRHLRSHKSGKLKRGYRRPNYTAGVDRKRLSRLLCTAVRTERPARRAEEAAGD